jgi:hypothetical protein
VSGPMSDAFNLLAVRTGEEPADTRYPEPGDEPDTIELEPADGSDPLTFTTGELNLRHMPSGSKISRISRIKDIKAQVFVTEARVAVACSKYDKGGGFHAFNIAALPLSVGLNTVSKVRASRRRKGKMLVGHIRYESLLSVGYINKSGLQGGNRLRVATVDATTTGRAVILDINLPKQIDGQELSAKIAGLAANYQLDHNDTISEQTREHLEALRSPEALPGLPKAYATYLLIPPAGNIAERLAHWS